MIFKEHSTNNFLPIIKNNSNDFREEEYYIPPNSERTSKIKKLSISTKDNNNNRYDIKDSLPNEKNNFLIKDKEIEKKAHTFIDSRSLTNENGLYKAKNNFIVRLELENISSYKDCKYLLDEYLRRHNLETHYETYSEQDKLIFLFDEEQTSFEFAKIIYNEKNKNSMYRNVSINLKLLPNNNYFKNKKIDNKKRTITQESIIKLYKGSSYTKNNKAFPKILGNVNFGIKSPFYNVHDNKNKKMNGFKIKNTNHLSRNKNNGDIFGYVGYNGLPLKSYEKLRISVLDTHYNPFCNYKYREENKKKWVSPSNFKYY